ncbi:MAG: DUF503 domain-containing protein [Planctomycetota bacterium]
MFVGALRVEYRVPGVRSLKEKRSPVRSVKERIANRFHCSVAEIGFQDKWQRTVIGVALVAETEKTLREQLTAVRRAMEMESVLQCVGVEEYVYDRQMGMDSDEWGTPEDMIFTDL